jgi:hypothetical protein
MTRLSAEDRNIEFDDFQPRDGPEHLLDSGHHAGQRRALLQGDPLID